MNYKVVKINELLSYSDGLELQQKVFDLVQQDIYDGVLLILEHKHVLTMGIRSNYDNLLVSERLLKEKDVELFKTNRGGDITYHGPGQIVAYPIMKLKKLNIGGDQLESFPESTKTNLRYLKSKGCSIPDLV